MSSIKKLEEGRVGSINNSLIDTLCFSFYRYFWKWIFAQTPLVPHIFFFLFIIFTIKNLIALPIFFFCSFMSLSMELYIYMNNIIPIIAIQHFVIILTRRKPLIFTLINFIFGMVSSSFWRLIFYSFFWLQAHILNNFCSGSLIFCSISKFFSSWWVLSFECSKVWQIKFGELLYWFSYGKFIKKDDLYQYYWWSLVWMTCLGLWRIDLCSFVCILFCFILGKWTSMVFLELHWFNSLLQLVVWSELEFYNDGG